MPTTPPAPATQSLHPGVTGSTANEPSGLPSPDEHLLGPDEDSQIRVPEQIAAEEGPSKASEASSPKPALHSSPGSRHSRDQNSPTNLAEPAPNAIQQSIDQHPVGELIPPLEVDDAPSEIDSAFSDGASSYTTSLSSSIYHYRYENGRRYHAFREGEYLLPNDEREQERLDIVHHIFRLTIGGDIYRSQLRNPQRILDLGTGTGLWAIECADLHPEAEVIGIDLSPIQPEYIPPNCRFIVDDIESDWPYDDDEQFDYIHLRTMCGSISDWDKLLNQIYKHLKPGGHVEFQEYEAWMKSDDDSINNAHSVMRWQTLIDEGTAKFGKRMNLANEIAGYLVNHGFINVEDEGYKVPCGTWPKDPAKKHLGQYMLLNMTEAVEPLAIALFTRVLGMSTNEAQILMAGVREEFRDPRLHLYAFYRFIYARKPLEGGGAEIG